MNDDDLMKVLLEPKVTEKSTTLGDKHNQYVFRVDQRATKTDVKQAVEFVFPNVKVSSVRIINMYGKKKMFQRKQGKRRDWKKAYVSLSADSTIDFMSI